MHSELGGNIRISTSWDSHGIVIGVVLRKKLFPFTRSIARCVCILKPSRGLLSSLGTRELLLLEPSTHHLILLRTRLCLLLIVLSSRLLLILLRLLVNWLVLI